jgi:hypothetical protein
MKVANKLLNVNKKKKIFSYRYIEKVESEKFHLVPTSSLYLNLILFCSYRNTKQIIISQGMLWKLPLQNRTATRAILSP